MFRCVFTAHSCEFNATFTREVQIPFAPFPGLKVGSLLDDDSDFDECVVKDVGWDVKHQYFDCQLCSEIDWIDIGDGIHPDWIDTDSDRPVHELYKEGLFHPED